MNDRLPVTVVGAGAWGTSLAHALADNGVEVTLWAIEPEVAEQVNSTHINQKYLPEVSLPKNLQATSDLASAVAKCRLVLVVVPSQFMRSVLKQLGPLLADDAVVVSATKGIEQSTLAMPVEMMRDTLPENIAKRLCVLSGPSFARELVDRVPTAVTIASEDSESIRLVQESFSSHYFRLYAHDDVIGVELGGAFKNVIAIAAGVSDGLGFGYNTRAAIITRGLFEMSRLGVALGGSAKTFAGLSGLGDLVLTCTGDLSRNRSVGLRLGGGESIADITNSMTAVAEGVDTSLSIRRLAEREGIDTPIATEVYRVIHEGKDPKQAVTDLMTRPPTAEFA